MDETKNNEEQALYSLDFLKHPERDFTAEMLIYIRTQFSHLLDEDDLKLLAKGDPAALEYLSKKIQENYKNTKQSLLDQ